MEPRFGSRSQNQPAPPSAQASGCLPPLLTANDLLPIAPSVGLQHIDGVDLGARAMAINSAFDSFAIWSRVTKRKTAPKPTKIWCRQVAGQARDLIYALGHAGLAPSDGHFGDALLHLEAGWPRQTPSGKGAGQGVHNLHRLEILLQRALPEGHSAADRNHAADTYMQLTWGECIGDRFAATLELLAILGERAAVHHAPQVRHGGSKAEKARKLLFCELAGEYKQLFGQLPIGSSPTVPVSQQPDELRNTLPGGKAVRWFRELINKAAERAEGLLQPADLADVNTDAANLNELLQRILALPSIAKGKGKKFDPLAGWITEGGSNWEHRAALPEDEIPDVESDPVPRSDLFP